MFSSLLWGIQTPYPVIRFTEIDIGVWSRLDPTQRVIVAGDALQNVNYLLTIYEDPIIMLFPSINTATYCVIDQFIVFQQLCKCCKLMRFVVLPLMYLLALASF